MGSVRKGIMLFVFFVVLFSTIHAVYAAIIPPVANDILSSLFSGLPVLWVQRFIIWILFFAVYFFAAANIFIDKNDKKKFSGVRITVAFVLALITALAMPDAVVSGIFNAFGWGAGILALGVPILGILYLAHQIFPQNRFGDGFRAIMFLVSMLLVGAITDALGSFASQPPGFSLTDLGGLCALIFFIMAIVNGVRSLFGTREKYPEGTTPDAQWNFNNEGIPPTRDPVRMVDAPGRAGRAGGDRPDGSDTPPGLMTITAVAPNGARQGDGTISLVMTGTNLNLLENVTFPSNANPRQSLQPAYPRVYNRTDTQCTADIRIENTTPIGLYDVAARARGQGDTFLRRAFEVQPRGVPPGGFAIVRAVPRSIEQDQNWRPVRVEGTQLDTLDTASVVFALTADNTRVLQIRNVARGGPTQFTCEVNVSFRDAAGTLPTTLGDYDILARNAAGIAATGGGAAFNIRAPGTPPPPPPPSNVRTLLNNLRIAIANYATAVANFETTARRIATERAALRPITAALWAEYYNRAAAVGAANASVDAAYNALLADPAAFAAALVAPWAPFLMAFLTWRVQLTNHLNTVRAAFITAYGAYAVIPAIRFPTPAPTLP